MTVKYNLILYSYGFAKRLHIYFRYLYWIIFIILRFCLCLYIIYFILVTFEITRVSSLVVICDFSTNALLSFPPRYHTVHDLYPLVYSIMHLLPIITTYYSVCVCTLFSMCSSNRGQGTDHLYSVDVQIAEDGTARLGLYR